MAERPDHAEAMAKIPTPFDSQLREVAALRRLYDVARRRYGRDVALDMAMDAVGEARR